MSKQTVEVGRKKVWIDLDNTPHVPFFHPIIRALEAEGHEVFVTARDAFQVCSLADRHGLAHTTIGRHYGANMVKKVAGTVWRAAQLLSVVRRERPEISMSHGSRSLTIVSGLLGIPSMLLFDYEHAERLPFTRPALGVTPEAINDPTLARGFRYGVRTYAGLKEDVYAASFRPDPSILTELGVSPDEMLVTIRPPATEAHYHNPEAEALYVAVVEMLGAAGIRMVILPRTAGTQREFILQKWPTWCDARTIVLPDHALDGLNLVWHSDFVVSGGGTMNREAAALGVPVYSIFRGKLGAVDRYLANLGRLTMVTSTEDVRVKVRLERRDKQTGPVLGDRPALRQILAAAHELMALSESHG
jgi:uncharacterized protein